MLALILIALMIVPDVVNLEYNLGSETKESMTIEFNESITGSFDISIANPVRDVFVSDGRRELKSEIHNAASGYKLTIHIKEPASKIRVNLTAENVVFESDSLSQFFTEVNIQAESVHTEILLPAGYGVYEDSYHPKDAQLSTDGRRITLSWEHQNVTKPLIYSVKYVPSKNNGNIWFVVATLSVVGVLGVIIYYKGKSHNIFLEGFREDEQKVIRYLEGNVNTLQSGIQKEFGFSKAKVTRILMRLEGKGLIAKEKCGRTNKVKWVKG